MFNDSVKVKKSEVAPILAASFPEYRGRTIKIEFTDKVKFYDTNWGGGTRNQYHALTMDGLGKRVCVRAPWANPIEGQTVILQPGLIVVCHTIFCGQDLGITIYAHPDMKPRMLTG